MTPEIGTKLSDGTLAREVLWADGRKVRVRSTWQVRGGHEAAHELTLPMNVWISWGERCKAEA